LKILDSSICMSNNVFLEYDGIKARNQKYFLVQEFEVTTSRNTYILKKSRE